MALEDEERAQLLGYIQRSHIDTVLRQAPQKMELLNGDKRFPRLCNPVLR